MKKKILLGFLALCLTLLYLRGAARQARIVNVPASADESGHVRFRSDQGGYMRYAMAMRDSGYRTTGDRNRMPLYPLLLSRVYRPGMTEAELFAAGKRFNIGLSLVLLLLLLLVASRFLPPFQAATLTLVEAFTVFVYKAGYVQCEVLFYFLNFLGFLAMLMLLLRGPADPEPARQREDTPAPSSRWAVSPSRWPGWMWGMAGGLAVALAHLTKASVLPGLVLCVALSASREAWAWWRGWKPNWAGAALLVAVFLATVFPYIRESRRIYGSWFFNVNSHYYMWYDSWQQAIEGTRAAGDRQGPPDLPPDQIPGPLKYLREHGPRGVLSRLAHGVWDVVHECLKSYGYVKYVAIFLLFAILWMWQYRDMAWPALQRQRFAALFVLSYFPAYLLLYAWYSPIVSADRLVLAQLLPFQFAISFLISREPFRSRPVRFFSFRLDWDQANALALFLLFFEIATELDRKIVSIYGGS